VDVKKYVSFAELDIKSKKVYDNSKPTKMDKKYNTVLLRKPQNLLQNIHEGHKLKVKKKKVSWKNTSI
jgi:hypothetical protein